MSSQPPSPSELVVLLQRAGLLESDTLDASTLASLASRIADDRVEFLSSLKECGLTLGERQRLANAIGHAARDQHAADNDALIAKLRVNDRDGAHALLKARGVAKLGERQRFIGDALKQLAAAPSPSTEMAATPRFSSAAEAIAAGQVAFVTLTNTGYLPFTANCLTTLDIVGEQLPGLTVYCADSASLDALKARASPPPLVPMHEDALSNFLAWKEKGWARLMWLKCEVMRRALEEYAFVVFTDGDITYERSGAIAYCVDMLLGNNNHSSHDGAATPPPELVMQNDGLYDDMKDGHGYCAGFMAARATPNTRDAFTVSEEDLTPGWDDQRHLNLIKDRLNVKALPLHLFPNGQYYQRHRERLSKARGNEAPYLVHWNWYVGSEGKREAMRANGRWYVGEG